MKPDVLVSQSGGEFGGAVLLPVVPLQYGFQENGASSSSCTDVNSPFSLPPPSDGLGPLPEDYVDPQQAAREPRNWPAHRRRLNHSVHANLWSMFKGHRDCLVDLTVTLAQQNGVPLDSLNAQRYLNQIRPHLDRLFVYWFLVLESDQNGNPHFHGAAVARGNICRGWNQAAWEKMQRGEPTDGQALTHNRRLVKLWAELRAHIPGRTTATPIMSEKAVVAYTTKKLHIPSSEWSSFKPGTRWVHCSKSMRRVVASTRFCWNTPRCRLARQKRSAIAAALRVSPQRCRQLFDSKKWHWHMTQLIAALDAQWPGWHESAADALEILVIKALTALDFCWAESLSMELGERRYRHLRGEPEDPAPQRDPGDIMREAMEWAAQWRAATLQPLTPPPPSIPSPDIPLKFLPYEFAD